MTKRFAVIAAGLFAVALLFLLGGGKSMAQQPPANYYKDPDEAAQAWLEIFLQTVNEANFKALGFESLDEVKQVELARPLNVRMLKFDQMREYQEGADLARLAEDVGWIIYPLYVGREVRVALELERRDDLWGGSKFGSGNFIQLLERARQTSEDYVLAFPALNQYFIASGPERELRLFPILDDVEYGWKAGEPLDPEEVLVRLSQAARQSDDLPK